MIRNGQQKRKLQEALIDAFPTKTSLEQMLSFELEKNLDSVAGGNNLQEIVFNLIKAAESQGWIEGLVHAALKSNSGNPYLKSIAEALLTECVVTAISALSPQSPALVSIDKLNNGSSSLAIKIQEAFDRELFILEKKSGNPNGIALSKLAFLAVEEEGDFDIALEAFVLLLRLAHLVRERGFSGVTSEEREDGLLTNKLTIQPVNTQLQSANVTNSTIKVLKLFAQTDHGLLTSANERARRYALIGNASFSHLSNYEQIPHESFGAISTIWYALCLDFDATGMTWAAKEMTRLMFNTLQGLAFTVSERGIVLPEAPKTIYMTTGGERWIEPNHHRDLLPIVSLANAIATLPIELFSFALELLPYFTSIFPLQNCSEHGKELTDEIEAIKRWAAIPGGSAIVCGILLKTQQDVETFNNELKAVHMRGNQVSVKLVEFLMAERVLVLKEKA